MAIPQWVELYKGKALTADSGTETFSIKRNAQILALNLVVRAKNGATSNIASAAALATIESSLTKITLKSGSADFKSYTGEMCRKIATYRNGKVPYGTHTCAVGGTYAGNDDPSLGWPQSVFPMNFTTKFDPYGTKTGCMLPAPLYDSLELVLDYNFSISATAGYLTGGANHLFDLYALVLPAESREVMESKKILVETKKHDYTTVASGDETFDLTTSKDRMLRQVFVHCYETGIGEGVDITDLKFRVNNDNYWAGNWGSIQHQNADDCKWDGVAIDNMYLVGNGTLTSYAVRTKVPSPYPYLIAGTAPTVAPYFATLAAGDQVTFVTDANTDVNLMQVRSPVIPGLAVIDLDLDGSQQFMQYAGVQDIDMILTNGGAGGAVQILEQHVARPWNY